MSSDQEASLRKISRALLSVSDKTGLIEFAKGLAAAGVTLISTGGTLVNAAIALLARGAKSVDVVATHGVLSDGALARLHAAPIDEICITDTIPYHNGSHIFDDAPKLRILSVAPLIAEAIVRVHEGRSVSELFR